MKRKPLTKRDMERICRDGGQKPVRRETIAGHEVFIADGFSLPPHYKIRHFGVGPMAHPHGCYTTMWFCAKGEELLGNGGFLICDAFHDPSLSKESKQRARINSALGEARQYFEDRKKALH